MVLDRYQLIIRQLLPPGPLVLRGGPYVHALAEIGVGVHVVELSITLPGDQPARRREQPKIGKLFPAISKLLIEASGCE